MVGFRSKKYSRLRLLKNIEEGERQPRSVSGYLPVTSTSKSVIVIIVCVCVCVRVCVCVCVCGQMGKGNGRGAVSWYEIFRRNKIKLIFTIWGVGGRGNLTAQSMDDVDYILL